MTTNIAVMQVGGPGRVADMQVIQGNTIKSENLTEIVSSVPSTLIAKEDGTVATVTAMTANIRVKVGENPTATQNDIAVLANNYMPFILMKGETVAIIASTA